MKGTVITFITLFLMLWPARSNGLSNQDEPADGEVLIGIRVAPPFVVEEDDGRFSGITVYLIEEIARSLDITYRFVDSDIQGMLDGVAGGDYFASASAITITSEREELVDFTHPFFVTGLGIAVPHRSTGLLGSLRALFSPDFWWVVLLLFGLLLFWGILVWIFERHENNEEFGGTAAEGIGSGFWWAAVTMTTVGYGDKSPRTLGGRIVGFIWMFTAILVISFFTASIASSLTVTQLESRVNGPEDLPGARVGVVQSATETFLAAENVSSRSYSTIEEGFDALEADQIDAFVHDAPIIAYIIQQGYRNRVRILPNTFNDQYYGIALPLNSEYRNQINQAVLEIINSNEWQQILRDYLGDS